MILQLEEIPFKFEKVKNPIVFGCKTTSELAKLVKRYNPKSECEVNYVLINKIESETKYFLYTNGLNHTLKVEDYVYHPMYSNLVDEICDKLNINI